MKKIQIAVIGASNPTEKEYKLAEAIGKEIARNGWVLINGGLKGVMEASAKGASIGEGLVVGVIPGLSTGVANEYNSVVVATNMGHARNMIIVHSADACIAIGGSEGTLSEIAIALKLGKKVVGIDTWKIPGVVNVNSIDRAIEEIRAQGAVSSAQCTVISDQ